MNKEKLLEIAKPILFNTEMVQAILEGRKTQTRRVVKSQPMDCTCEDCEKRDEIYFNARSGYIRCRNCNSAIYNGNGKFCFAPYNIGDILYVRETWERLDCSCCEGDGVTGSCFSCPDTNEGCYVYRASHYITGDARWHPSIHMPKEAARIFLKVTDVRVERLQDITEEQAKQEGVLSTLGIAARTGFKTVWSSTIKTADRDKYSWDANPWVWVIEFERVTE